MKICPYCKRNMNKLLHNWSEIVAGIGVLMCLLPIILLLYDYNHIFGIISFIGLIITDVACVVHLWSEVRVKKYR